MGVIGVGDVHLHGDAVALRLEVLQDPRLGQLHAELGPTHADVRIFTEARRRRDGRKIIALSITRGYRVTRQIES